MLTFKTRWFAGCASKRAVSDTDLGTAMAEMQRGLVRAGELRRRP